jgi:hypothetical protein
MHRQMPNPRLTARRESEATIYFQQKFGEQKMYALRQNSTFYHPLTASADTSRTASKRRLEPSPASAYHLVNLPKKHFSQF